MRLVRIKQRVLHFLIDNVARTKRADLQQICNRSVLTKTVQLQTNLSSVESVFSLGSSFSLGKIISFLVSRKKKNFQENATKMLK